MNSVIVTGPCTPAQFERVKQYIADFELDNRDLDASQFTIATYRNTLLGFGRIREHAGCSELCSLGVIEPERNKGIGRALVAALIPRATQPLYLACIIPHYFEPFGFSICTEYPEAMADKLRYCVEDLPVPEPYYVMGMLNFKF